MCQVCNKEFPRGEFHQHQCIKEFYLEKLYEFEDEVIEHLAEKLCMYKAQWDGDAECINP